MVIELVSKKYKLLEKSTNFRVVKYFNIGDILQFETWVQRSSHYVPYMVIKNLTKEISCEFSFTEVSNICSKLKLEEINE